jgi:hypothetical protein
MTLSHWFRTSRAVSPLLLLACTQAVSPSMANLSVQGRVHTCALLSQKISIYGPMNAVATALAGGSGVAAAFKESNKNRETLGILTALFTATAAWTNYKEKRQVDRYNDFNCAFLFRIDPADSVFKVQYRSYQFGPGFHPDSLPPAQRPVAPDSTNPH